MTMCGAVITGKATAMPSSGSSHIQTSLSHQPLQHPVEMQVTAYYQLSCNGADLHLSQSHQ